jgi:DNA-binding NarL/FixJ family response regulator
MPARDSLKAKRAPSPVKNSAQAVNGNRGGRKKKAKVQIAGVTGRQTRVEQAEARTEQAVSRTEQARTRAESAETRTEQAETRTEQAKTRTDQAEVRTEQAETRTEQAETALKYLACQPGVLRRETPSRMRNELPVNEIADQASRVAKLTSRRREILQLIAEGQNTKQIAQLLKVSPKTIEYHRVKLMNCLNVHDVPGLVRFALRMGLIPQES